MALQTDTHYGRFAKSMFTTATRDNPPSRSSLVTRSLAGASGMMLATYVYDKIRKRKTSAKRLAIAALLGGGAGAFSSYYTNFMKGRPFVNLDFNEDTLSPGERVYLGVAGAANGEGTGWFAKEMQKNLPKGHVKMFRWVDGKDLENTYVRLKNKGITPIIVAHSRGGAAAARVLKRHPDARGYLLDPTSYSGRQRVPNATVFTVDRSVRNKKDIGNIIANIGGRWNQTGDNVLHYKGTHTDHAGDIISDIVLPGYDTNNLPEQVPEYIIPNTR